MKNTTKMHASTKKIIDQCVTRQDILNVLRSISGASIYCQAQYDRLKGVPSAIPVDKSLSHEQKKVVIHDELAALYADALIARRERKLHSKKKIIKFRYSDLYMDTNPSKYTKLELYAMGLNYGIVLKYEKLTKAQMIAAIVEGIQQSEQKKIDEYLRSHVADADQKSKTQQEREKDEVQQSQKVTHQPAEIAPKPTRTTRKRSQITVEDIRACSDEIHVLALLEGLSLKELKSWAKSLKIRLEHLKGMNNKAKLSKHIAYSVIREKELKEFYSKKRVIKTGSRVATLTEHYFSMDEKTGQISFTFC